MEWFNSFLDKTISLFQNGERAVFDFDFSNIKTFFVDISAFFSVPFVIAKNFLLSFPYEILAMVVINSLLIIILGVILKSVFQSTKRLNWKKINQSFSRKSHWLQKDLMEILLTVFSASKKSISVKTLGFQKGSIIFFSSINAKRKEALEKIKTLNGTQEKISKHKPLFYYFRTYAFAK